MEGIIDTTAQALSAITDNISQITSVVRSQSLSAFAFGPIVPSPLSHTLHNSSQLLGASLACFRFANAVTLGGPFPIVAATTAALPLILSGRSYRLYDVGLQPSQMMEHNEWHRIVTSQLVGANYAQLFVGGCDVYEYGRRLEIRWGLKRCLLALGSSLAVGSGLYVASTTFAHRYLPTSSLAHQYTSSYLATGPIMAGIGLSVIAGYDQDAEMSSGSTLHTSTVFSARYTWGGTLMMAALVSEDVATREALLCSVVGGLAVVYGFGWWANRGWGRRAGLGLLDAGLQAALIGLAVVAGWLGSREDGSMGVRVQIE